MTTPEPRPALRRADDAGVHPALAVAPSHAPPPFSVGSEEPAKPGKARRSPSPRLKVAPEAETETSKGGGKAARTAGGRKFRAAGSATSDALRPARAKQVPLQVRVPKAIRKQLRAVAKNSGASLDEIVVTALNDWLGDPRRW